MRMKKLKCQSCSGVWVVEDNDLNRQKVCPYCTSSIQDKVEFEDYDSLDKAIYGAITNIGIGVIQNPHRLSGFMMDTAPALKKEIRIFTKTVTEKYTRYVKKAFDQDVGAAEAAIKNLRHLFIEEEGLSDAWADMICEGLHGAALYCRGIGCTKLVNVQIDDFQFESEGFQKFKTETCTEPSVKKGAATVKKTGPKPSVTKNTILDILPGDDPGGLCGLALRYYYGTPKNERMAIKLLRESANYHQYIPAYNYLGRIFMKTGKVDNSLKWYQKSYDAGDVEGACMMGYFYQKGYAAAKRSAKTEALECYIKAASTGEFDRMVAIAKKFLAGGDFPKEEEVAVGILNAAAKVGSLDAYYYLVRPGSSGH